MAGGEDTVEERIPVAGRDIVLARPREWEGLLTEESFEREELLPYWAHLWASAVALAQAVAHERVEGLRVLELGCGLGLPSIAAARAGALVTATDWSPAATRATARNAALNAVELEVATVDWSQADCLLARAPWDLVLASDVLYERPMSKRLLGLLPLLGPAVLLADPGRAPAQAFFDGVGERWERSEVFARTEPRVTVHRLRRRAGVPA